MNYRLWLCGLLLLSGWCCANKQKDASNGRILAEVYDKTLRISDLHDIIPTGTSPEDSALIVSAFVQRWAREQLLMYEAERNIPKDLDIDELVRNYRASLVRYNYEEKLIAQKLDSTISDAETRAFYEENKDQFQLEATILKCLLLKISTQAPQTEINKLWNSRAAADREKLKKLAGDWKGHLLSDPEKWYKLEEVAAFLPKGTLTTDNAGSRREGTLNEGGFRYYYRVLEVRQGQTTAPYDFVREQASKVILHRRKQQILDQWQKDVFDTELRRENVKIFK
jgi:SLT domain-containing protein